MQKMTQIGVYFMGNSVNIERGMLFQEAQRIGHMLFFYKIPLSVGAETQTDKTRFSGSVH